MDFDSDASTLLYDIVVRGEPKLYKLEHKESTNHVCLNTFKTIDQIYSTPCSSNDRSADDC